MDTERKSFPFQLEEKGIDLEQGTFAGYAAVCGNLDDGGDIIDMGAFKKTIQERGPDSPRNRLKVFRYHDPMMPIGKIVDIREVPKGQLPKEIRDNYPGVTGGLFVKGKISPTPAGEEVLTLMRDNVVDEMSIAYETMKEEFDGDDDGDGARHLKEIKLYSCDPVPLAMNPAALVVGVKNQQPDTEVKGVVPFQDLPLADEDMAWDYAAAKKRVAAWAGGPDKEDIDWGKYRKAFIWYDAENPEQLGSYHLGIGDIVDGSLKAVPRGIFAVVVVLSGGRGGWTRDVDGCKAHIARYYKKMDRDVPWKAIMAAVEEHEAVLTQIYDREAETEDVEKGLLRAKMQRAEMLQQEIEARMR